MADYLIQYIYMYMAFNNGHCQTIFFCGHPDIPIKINKIECIPNEQVRGKYFQKWQEEETLRKKQTQKGTHPLAVHGWSVCSDSALKLFWVTPNSVIINNFSPILALTLHYKLCWNCMDKFWLLWHPSMSSLHTHPQANTNQSYWKYAYQGQVSEIMQLSHRYNPGILC